MEFRTMQRRFSANLFFSNVLHGFLIFMAPQDTYEIGD
jgi:hypothetical protein